MARIDFADLIAGVSVADDDPSLIHTAADLQPYNEPDKYAPLFRNIFADVGVIALRFDDGRATDVSYVQGQLASRGLLGSFAIANDLIGTTGFIGTWAEVVALATAGHEIQCHTKTHSSPTSLAQFVVETTGAADTLRGQGLYVQSFVQPGPWEGDYYIDTTAKLNGPIGRWLQRNFAVSEHYVPDSLHTNLPGGVKSIPVPFRYGLSHVAAEDKTYAQVKAAIDRARAYQGYTELIFHSTLIGTPGYISTADFELVLDYIKAGRDAGTLLNLTPSAAAFAQPGTPRNMLGDNGFVLYPNDGAWTAVGSPAVVAGGGPDGQNVMQSSRANYVFQQLAARHLRSVEVVGWAKAVGSNSTARMQVQSFDASAVLIDDIQVSATVTSAGWTRFRALLGTRPGVDYLQIRGWTSASGQPDVYWCWKRGALAIDAGAYRR